MAWRPATPEEKRASYEKAAALGERLATEGWNVAIIETLRQVWEVQVRIPMRVEEEEEEK